MSFDLIAFDLTAAPVDRYQFLGWIRDQCSGSLLAEMQILARSHPGASW